MTVKELIERLSDFDERLEVETREFSKRAQRQIVPPVVIQKTEIDPRTGKFREVVLISVW